MQFIKKFHVLKFNNNNFVLTRNKTILQNHGICDFCYHDKRKESEIVHPDEEFWNSL